MCTQVETHLPLPLTAYVSAGNLTASAPTAPLLLTASFDCETFDLSANRLIVLAALTTLTFAVPPAHRQLAAIAA